MKKRHFDHIDLRVKNMDAAIKFYSQLLPALGFDNHTESGYWETFYSMIGDRRGDFFGFTEDPNHQPNGTRIAFWAESREELDRVAEVARAAGARNIEGPELCVDYTPGYHAVFFEDPDGNKLEICFREYSAGT
jgi:catechol 2,3-dioxygenase-like lactoylglutathione lyase family enzyme